MDKFYFKWGSFFKMDNIGLREEKQNIALYL